MKSIEQLKKVYEREVELAEKHKNTAADIKKQIDALQGKMIIQKINALNMSGEEYDKFIKLLGRGKKTIFETAEQVLGKEKNLPEKGDEKGLET